MKKRFIALLASLVFLFTAVTAVVTPAVAYAATSPFAVTDISLYDVDGTTTTLNGDLYGGTKRIVIVGRTTCMNTQNEVSAALALSAKDAYSDVNFLVLDYDSGRDAFISYFGPKETDSVRFFSDDKSTYRNWAHNTVSQAGGGGSLLPFVFVIDENDEVVHGEMGPQNLAVLCENTLGIKNPDGVTANVHGYVDTQAGLELLTLVNKARAAVGVDPLVWDADLAQTAIQRATEISIYYSSSHNRPDGSECFTAWPSWAYGMAENIAAGYDSVQDVNTGWTNSSGHYQNMIRSNMKSFGAALYVGSNGYTYWVECFAAPVGPNGVGTAIADDITSTVNFDRTYVNFKWSDSTRNSVYVGNSFKMSTPKLGDADLADNDLIWSTSDPSIFTVSSDGVITGVAKGSATLTCALANNPACYATRSINVWENDDPGIDIDGATVSAIPNQTYTGSSIKPSVTVTLGGRTLVEGTDYYVSCNNNYDVGTATMTISGTGNYTGSKSVFFYIVAPIVPVITGEPSGFMGAEGETATFSVAAMAATSLSYRWQQSTDNGVTWTNVASSVTGYNASTMSVKVTSELDGRMFRCIVTDTAGNTATSKAVQVSIVPDGYVARGFWGTCEWDIDEDGLLTVHPGEGASQSGLGKSPWGDFASVIKRVVFATEGGKKVVAPANMRCLLIYLEQMESVDASGLDTSAVTSMPAVFFDCPRLTTLDLSTWDTSNVQNMEALFKHCSSLTELNLSGWNTAKVYDMEDMFANCSSLTELDVSHFDTSELYYMSEMFYNCASLTSIDLSSFDTSGVGYCDSVFTGCTALASVTVGTGVTATVLRQLPSYSVNGHSDWYSTVANEWFTPSQIGNNRAGIADTYTKWSGEAVDISDAEVYVRDQTFTGEALTPDVQVFFNGQTLVFGTDYTVKFTNNTMVGTATVTVIGTGVYTGSATGTFAIMQVDLSAASISVDTQTYTGEALKPTITVKINNRTLMPGSDYTVTYSNNTAVGTAAFTLTGTGNYKGTRTGYFSIVAASIADATVTFEDQVYAGGEAIEPSAMVVLNGRTLVEGTDYALTYSNNRKAGTATVAVTGRGNYTGSVNPRPTFRILPASIEDAQVYASSVEYTGSPVTTTVSVFLGEKVLTAGTDFTVSYENNVEVGEATAIVTGKGNYTGTASTTFYITGTPKTNISGATVTAANQTYTGSALRPTVTVKLNGKTLTLGTDYTVAYSNNIEVGTATITVTGKGDYTGTATGHFTISKAAEPVKTGWQQVNGTWYYYDNNGKPMTNHWEKYSGKWYFFGADGKLVITGWATYQGTYYYYRNASLVKSGWVVEGNNYFYLQNYSPVVNTWIKYNGTWYHFGANGICDQVWKG